MASNWDELEAWSFSAEGTRGLEAFFCLRPLILEVWRNFVGVQRALEAGRRPAGKNQTSGRFFGEFRGHQRSGKILFCPAKKIILSTLSIELFYIGGQRLKSLQSCFFIMLVLFGSLFVKTAFRTHQATNTKHICHQEIFKHKFHIKKMTFDISKN